MDVDLADMQPDFYSGSAHKWIPGPKENGVLYINKSAQSADLGEHLQRLSQGAFRLCRKSSEGFGQRDEPR